MRWKRRKCGRSTVYDFVVNANGTDYTMATIGMFEGDDGKQWGVTRIGESTNKEDGYTGFWDSLTGEFYSSSKKAKEAVEKIFAF